MTSSPSEMSATTDADWQMTSSIMGERVLPAMQRLPELISDLGAAVLCTADGYNLCALGLEERQVGKMAALASSLFSLGTAVVAEVNGSKDTELDSTVLASRDNTIIGIKIPHSGVRYLVLMVSATRPSLGIMLHGCNSVAAEIRELF